MGDILLCFAIKTTSTADLSEHFPQAEEKTLIMAWSLGDALLLLDRTLLNPLLTGLAIAAVLVLDPPAALDVRVLGSRILSSIWLLRLCAAFVSGALLRLNRILSRKALNNGVSANFDWSREIIVVTGGSGGIGAATAIKLASRGSKVVILDVLPLTFEPRK